MTIPACRVNLPKLPYRMILYPPPVESQFERGQVADPVDGVHFSNQFYGGKIQINDAVLKINYYHGITQALGKSLGNLKPDQRVGSDRAPRQL